MLERLTFDKLVQLSQKTNYYERLGLDDKASAADIKASYLQIVSRLHPDLIDDPKKETAKEATKKINEAYETLKDPQKRADYDIVHSRPQQRPDSQQNNGQNGYPDSRNNNDTLVSGLL
jgi:DnaJ-class molecular chaperone